MCGGSADSVLGPNGPLSVSSLGWSKSGDFGPGSDGPLPGVNCTCVACADVEPGRGGAGPLWFVKFGVVKVYVVVCVTDSPTRTIAAMRIAMPGINLVTFTVIPLPLPSTSISPLTPIKNNEKPSIPNAT